MIYLIAICCMDITEQIKFFIAYRENRLDLAYYCQPLLKDGFVKKHLAV